MRKRIGLFVGLLSILAVSLGLALSGTGAYFSDQTSGTSKINAGHVKIGQPADVSATFDNMMPGQDREVTKTLFIDSTVPVDVYVRSTKVGSLSADDMAHFDAGLKGSGVTNGEWRKLADDVNAGPFTITPYAHLDISADNDWQYASAQVDYDIQIIQGDRPGL